MKTFACLLAAMLLARPAWGITADAAPEPAPPAGNEAATAVPVQPASVADCQCVPAGSPVELEIGEALSSATRKRGDKFAIKLHAPITHADKVVIPAGAMGLGEIVHAERSRGGGKPGELLLAGRYLEFAGTRIPLRGMKASATGDTRYGAALGTAFLAGPFAMFVRGREIEIPAGTRVTAKLAQNLVLPVATGNMPVAVDSPVTTVPNQE